MSSSPKIIYNLFSILPTKNWTVGQTSFKPTSVQSAFNGIAPRPSIAQFIEPPAGQPPWKRNKMHRGSAAKYWSSAEALAGKQLCQIVVGTGDLKNSKQTTTTIGEAGPLAAL